MSTLPYVEGNRVVFRFNNLERQNEQYVRDCVSSQFTRDVKNKLQFTYSSVFPEEIKSVSCPGLSQDEMHILLVICCEAFRHQFC